MTYYRYRLKRTILSFAQGFQEHTDGRPIHSALFLALIGLLISVAGSSIHAALHYVPHH